MEMGTADQGLAALLDDALLDALTVLIRARIDFTGDLQPDEVPDLLIGDLLLNHCSPFFRIRLEELDGMHRPAVISFFPIRQRLAVLWGVP